MVSRIAQWTLDVQDLDRMAAFWSQALGYDVDPDGGPAGGDRRNAHLRPPGGGGFTVWLQATAEPGPKRGKNRAHPDLRTDGDVDAEADRLVGLGAARVDNGQRGDEGFVVLADPEGNEFCILRGGG